MTFIPARRRLYFFEGLYSVSCQRVSTHQSIRPESMERANSCPWCTRPSLVVLDEENEQHPGYASPA